jgi:hypothetical protein
MEGVLTFLIMLCNAENIIGFVSFWETYECFLLSLTNVKSLRGNKRPWRSIGDNQYIIDAGQKKFGATQCKECGTVYQIGDPDDETSHQKYHNSVHDLKYTVCSWIFKILED